MILKSEYYIVILYWGLGDSLPHHLDFAPK